MLISLNFQVKRLDRKRHHFVISKTLQSSINSTFENATFPRLYFKRNRHSQKNFKLSGKDFLSAANEVNCFGLISLVVSPVGFMELHYCLVVGFIVSWCLTDTAQETLLENRVVNHKLLLLRSSHRNRNKIIQPFHLYKQK